MRHQAARLRRSWHDRRGAVQVRDEDAFDVAAVAEWLREHAAEHWRERLDGTPDVRQFPGGASNLTYLLAGPARPDPAPAADGVKAKGAHDMGREHRVQAALAPVFPLVPEMVAHCDDEAVIGAPFYVMDARRGHHPAPRAAGARARRASRPSRLCGSFWDVLVSCTGRPRGRRAGRPRQGRGLRRAAGRRGWTTGSTTPAPTTWATGPTSSPGSRRTGPPTSASCLIHNDFRFDNLVLAPGDPRASPASSTGRWPPSATR